MRRSISIIIATALIGAVVAEATEPPRKPRTIQVIGRTEATVTGATVRLGDIAVISSSDPRDDDAIIGLENIVVDASPTPGRENTLSAQRVLDRMKAGGVDLDTVAYTLPRTIVARRAARTVTEGELLPAIEAALKQSGRDIVVKRLVVPGDVHVAPTDTVAGVTPFTSRTQGRLGFTVGMRAESGESASFNVEAIIDEWMQLPVAKRSLSRGTIVTADDVMLARLNVSGLPGDTAREERGVVGLATSSDISFGEVFRRNKLAIPNAIEANSRVTLVYRSAGFEATASGLALEGGIVGTEVKVRNESSKKIITGTILEPGLVGVKP